MQFNVLQFILEFTFNLKPVRKVKLSPSIIMLHMLHLSPEHLLTVCPVQISNFALDKILLMLIGCLFALIDFSSAKIDAVSGAVRSKSKLEFTQL